MNENSDKPEVFFWKGKPLPDDPEVLKQIIHELANDYRDLLAEFNDYLREENEFLRGIDA